MNPEDKDHLSQLNEHLNSGNQSWLFGAGISFGAGIPLMNPLTERIFKRAKEEGEPGDSQTLKKMKDQLVDGFHIEHVLSQIGDYRAIGERSKNKGAMVGGKEYTLDELDKFHARIVNWIAETVRWGFRAKTKNSAEAVGDKSKSIVKVDDHLKFVAALLSSRQMGLSNRRRAVRFFTTNYDTLLEDALALSCVPTWDGFSGGAVAYRNYRYGDQEPDRDYRAHVIKLHGSIDWHLGKDGKIWRVRDCDVYPEKDSRVIIYPQSVKYLATQRDPFAAQFDLLRRSLSSSDENVFIFYGYSFGDEHINQEVELAMDRPESKTTMIVFAQSLCEPLEVWRKRSWGERLFVATEDGLYIGESGPFARPDGESKLDWWTFEGVARVLENGPEACFA